jgi:hypothetical protein
MDLGGFVESKNFCILRVFGCRCSTGRTPTQQESEYIHTQQVSPRHVGRWKEVNDAMIK